MSVMHRSKPLLEKPAPITLLVVLLPYQGPSSVREIDTDAFLDRHAKEMQCRASVHSWRHCHTVAVAARMESFGRDAPATATLCNAGAVDVALEVK